MKSDTPGNDYKITQAEMEFGFLMGLINTQWIEITSTITKNEWWIDHVLRCIVEANDSKYKSILCSSFMIKKTLFTLSIRRKVSFSPWSMWAGGLAAQGAFLVIIQVPTIYIYIWNLQFIITVPADGLAPSGVRPWAVAVFTTKLDISRA